MKNKKLLAALLSLALAIATFCGCGELTLYESATGISLYMDKGFTEMEMEGTTTYFDKGYLGLNCLEETFELLETVGYGSETTVEEYAQLIVDVYGLEGEVETDDYGNTYTLYVQEIEGVSYSYYAFFDKGSTSFWTSTFLCATENADLYEDDFKEWASTITVK